MSFVKVCALPSCDNVVKDKPFKLGLYPGEYCSRECVNDAYTLKKSGQPFSKVPEDVPVKPFVADLKEKPKTKKVPHIDASDFGDVGVIRHFCDNSSCTNPGRNPVMEIYGKLLTVITLCWKGRSGEYCSNECMKTEKEKKMPKEAPEVEEVDEVEEDDSPVSTGTTPAKKSGKKGAAKKAAPVAKKGAAKKAAPVAATKKATTKKASSPRDGSVMEKVLALLKRKSGTTHEEVMELTGWNKHTTQSMFSPTTMKVKHGVKVISEKVGDVRKYFIK
jgi:hypothetical protein